MSALVPGRAALRLMRKLLRKQRYAPDILVTDRLASVGLRSQP
jgi:hypothetical protein